MKTDRQKLIKELDDLFSSFIRQRALLRTGGCERCLSFKPSHKNLQAAHYHSRRKLTTRWNIDNAIGSCGGCHMYLDSHPVEKIAFFQNLLGPVLFNLLNIQANSIYRVDLKNTKLYLTELLKELENDL